MLSSTFNSPNALCYCHPHFKEKLIERFAADGLRNLPDPRASKQKSQNSKLKSSASKSVRWPQWCCRFSVSRRLPEDSGQRLWTTLMEDFIGTFGMNIWLSGQTDQLSSPYLSSANCETKDQNSCHLPPACSPEWDKSSQLLYKKHFFSCQSSACWVAWKTPDLINDGIHLYSLEPFAMVTLFSHPDSHLPHGLHIHKPGTPSSERVPKVTCICSCRVTDGELFWQLSCTHF